MPLQLPRQSYLAWKVLVIFFHATAVLSTLYRLAHRLHIRRLWWDDYIVLIPLIFDLTYWIVACARFPGSDNIASIVNTAYNSYWLVTLPGIMVLSGNWTVLALTLARLFPSKHPARRSSFVLVAYLCLSCVACITVTISTCRSNSGLLNQGDLQSCIKGPGRFVVRNIFLFAESLASDTLLIIFCLVLISWMQLVSAEHRIILVILCGNTLSLLYTIAFLVISNSHAISMGEDVLMIVTGMGNVQTALSLLIANLPVLCTCLFGSIRRFLHIPTSSSNGSIEASAEQYSSRPSDCSCYSESPTPLTLTEISNLSCQSSAHSSDSMRISETSREIYEGVSPILDADIEEKQHRQNLYRDTDIPAP